MAFLGDSVWEVHMRTAMHRDGPWRPGRADAVVKRVNTRALAAVYDLLTSRVQPWVSREEGAVLRWAANSATVSAPPHATRLQYKKATAVEVLVAQLYLTDAPRLDALVAHLMAPEVQRSWVDGGDGGGPSKGGSSSTLGAADISLEEGSGVGSESGGAGSDGAGGGEDAQRSGRAGGHATTPGAVAGVAGTLQGGEQADEVAPAAAGAPLPRSKAVGFGGPGRGRGRGRAS